MRKLGALLCWVNRKGITQHTANFIRDNFIWFYLQGAWRNFLQENRESGESPERSRHCNCEERFIIATWQEPGKAKTLDDAEARRPALSIASPNFAEREVGTHGIVACGCFVMAMSMPIETNLNGYQCSSSAQNGRGYFIFRVKLSSILGEDAAMRRGVLTPFRTTSFSVLLARWAGTARPLCR